MYILKVFLLFWKFFEKMELSLPQFILTLSLFQDGAELIFLFWKWYWKVGQTSSDQAEILTAKNMDIEEYSLKFSAL